MSAHPHRRRSRGDWISNVAASADIRTPGDALAFLVCGALVALLAWMVLNPRQCYELIIGVFA